VQLFFRGVDIAPKVGISKASIIDSAGGQLDSVEVVFADPEGLWSGWDPQLGDSIRLAQDSFDSGECYVDQRGQRQGLYILRGLSAPEDVKSRRSRSWEKVTLLQLAGDVASAHGLTLAPYHVRDQTYDWVDQTGQGDLEFLAARCALESIAVKVNNKKLILYDEAAFEAAAPVRTIRRGDLCGGLEFLDDQSGLCSGCIVSYGGVTGEFMVPGGSGSVAARGDLYVTSIGEAQRFAKGLARQANRRARMLAGTILLDLTLAGGSMVRVTGVGTADGLYMVDEAEHLLTEGLTSLRLRKRLEGY
jgi:hypothetical protein